MVGRQSRQSAGQLVPVSQPDPILVLGVGVDPAVELVTLPSVQWRLQHQPTHSAARQNGAVPQSRFDHQLLFAYPDQTRRQHPSVLKQAYRLLGLVRPFSPIRDFLSGEGPCFAGPNKPQLPILANPSQPRLERRLTATDDQAAVVGIYHRGPQDSRQDKADARVTEHIWISVSLLDPHELASWVKEIDSTHMQIPHC